MTEISDPSPAARPTPNPSRLREGDWFAEAALQLSGQTAVLLGWRPDEFWNATPAELAAILAAMVPPDAMPPDQGTFTKLMEMYPDG